MEKFFYAEIIDNKVTVKGNLRANLGTRIKGEGFFAEWNWDGRTFTLTNDRYGFYPIYIAREDNRFAVSASTARLLSLGFSQDLDLEAIAVFLRFSSFIGEDTAFKSIRAVPPGSTLVWENGNLDIRSRGIIIHDEYKPARREAILGYGELFQNAIEKTLPIDKNLALPLSGGRDSRHILFSLCRAENPPEVCLTAVQPPPSANEDVRIAQRLCAELDLDHHLIRQNDSRFVTERNKNIKTGFGDFEHGWFMAIADYIRNKWNVIYDGIGGDMLTEDHFFNRKEFFLFKDEKLPGLADRFLQPEAYLPKILTREFYQMIPRQIAVERMVREMEKHVAAPNPFSSFYLWNRTRRCVTLSFFRLLNEDIDIIPPYMDSDLFDFLSSLPGEMFFGNSFHKETIDQFFPEYKHIPFENLNAPPNLNKVNLRRFSRDILRYSFSERKSHLTRRGFFLTRCVRGMLDKNYGKNITDFGDLSIFLLQLERLDSEISTHLPSLQPDQYPRPAKRGTKHQRDYRESQWQLPS